MPPRRGSQSPPLLNLPLLIVLLPTIIILALLTFAFASSNVFPPRTRPVSSSSSTTTSSVWRSWDSLNVFLVLFAILCGVFARRNDDESVANEEGGSGISSHVPASLMVNDGDERRGVHHQWYGSQFSEQKFYAEPETTPVGRLKRNSSSYPDLRQESLWGTGDDRLRFFDDFEIRKYRNLLASPVPGNLLRDSPLVDTPREMEIQEDTFVPRSSPMKSATPPPAPSPPPPSASANRNPKRSYETIPRKVQEIKEVTPPPPPPPPPPPRPPPVVEDSKSERRNGRKRSNATKEIKSVLTSLYNSQRKRKKKYKMRNSSLRDETAYPPPDTDHPSFTRPPPPPPPPPPPSLLKGFFRKGSKSKRIHSLTAPPPPPPPPPPRAFTMPRSKETVQKPAPPPETSKRRSSSGASWRPPLPTPPRASTPIEELDNFGCQSPLIPLPPPPPPPFKVPGFRFVVRGDYVKVRSASSSRCSSPDRDLIEAESTNPTSSGGGGPVSCPSPDVNIKADTFIARLRDGWRLEKMNSTKGIV